MKDFNPNEASSNDSGIFGLPYEEKDSELILIPVPWEVTTSYGGGTSQGPKAILEASKQVDLFDLDVLKPYEAGIYLKDENNQVHAWNVEGKKIAQQIIEAGGRIENQPELIQGLQVVNQLSEKLNQSVYESCLQVLQKKKIVGVLGGDHSVPYGAIQAIAKTYPSFGILHFDAHADLRDAYEGFQWSHASIMNNVMKNIPQVIKLTQVGIRDVCEEEIEFARQEGSRIEIYTDRDLSRKRFEGASWSTTCQEIIASLPDHVWISFDIDGLDPRFCPHTGTPVPGGLDFQEANYLIGSLVRSGRKIIGFDLNEVSPNLDNPNDEWDANVGARLLYKLCGWTLASQNKAKLS